MFRHTPGPWTIDRDQRTQNPEFIRAQIDGEMFDIAALLCDETKNEEANARLIAAAPRLLDALNDYLAAHDKAATEGKLSLGIDAGFDLHLMYNARMLIREITG